MPDMWYFAYGTLMRGMSNHFIVAPEIKQILPARAEGMLYHLPRGYPVLVEEGSGTVYGELILISKDSPAAAALDDLEDFIAPGHPDNLYERVMREIHMPGRIITARVYVCPPHHLNRVKKTGLPVPGGDWRKLASPVSPMR